MPYFEARLLTFSGGCHEYVEGIDAVVKENSMTAPKAVTFSNLCDAVRHNDLWVLILHTAQEKELVVGVGVLTVNYTLAGKKAEFTELYLHLFFKVALSGVEGDAARQLIRNAVYERAKRDHKVDMSHLLPPAPKEPDADVSDPVTV